MFKVLVLKEFREFFHTSKLVVLVAIFLIVGLISPVLAKYTPVMLKSIPNLPAGLEGIIPEPTITDAVVQYVKNMQQFGILVVILLGMGMIAQEKERGTAAMLLVKPVRRAAMIMAKWLALAVCTFGAILLGGLACLFYTQMLFGSLPIGSFLVLNLLLAVFLAVYLTVALFASALARTQTMAAAGAFGGLIVLLILSSLPRISDYLPGQLLNWGSALIFGGNMQAWPALIVAVSLIVLLILGAILKFEREEI